MLFNFPKQKSFGRICQTRKLNSNKKCQCQSYPYLSPFRGNYDNCECEIASDECGCFPGPRIYSGTCFDSNIKVNDLTGTMAGDGKLLLKNEIGQELNLEQY